MIGYIEGIYMKVRKINFSTGSYKICVLNKQDAEEMDLNTNDRVIIKHKNNEICAFVDIDRIGSIVKKGEIGLFYESYNSLNVDNGDDVIVYPTGIPKSVEYIIKKMNGNKLNKEEIFEIIKDVVKDELSEVEATAFITSCYIRGLDLEETVNLTEAIVESGPRPNFNKKIILDKHCIGGVPGNRTTMLVVPIVAAAGFYIPKTSSRAITSPAGTADTMEVFAPVDLTVQEIEEVVKKANGCMVWGGGSGIAAADDKLIQIRKPLHLDPLGVMLASILAKKKAVRSTHVLIDIPFGKGAKVETEIEGKELAKHLITVGTHLGMNVKCILTDGSAPIGNAIGPCLEAKQHLEILLGLKRVPDLVNKSILMAGKIMEYAGLKDAYNVAKEIFLSGKAYDKFLEIVELQGGDPKIKPEDIPIGSKTYDVYADTDGKIRFVNNKIISKIAHLAGCPKTKEAGVYLYYNTGAKVRKGDKLMTIYAESEAKLTQAIKYLEENNPFYIGNMIYEELDGKAEVLNYKQ